MKYLFFVLMVSCGLLLTSCNLALPTNPTSSEPTLDTQAAFWEQVGAAWYTATQDWAPYYSVALDNSDQPVVAYTKYPTNTDNTQDLGIYVRHWTGSSWAYYGAGPIGCLNLDTVGCGKVTVAVNRSSNTPIIAWLEDDPNAFQTSLYVQYWTGSAWAEYAPGALNSFNTATDVSLAVASDGNPVVAWVESNGDGGYLLYVNKWNGSAWVSFDPNGFNINNHSWSNLEGLSLALESNNNPVVAWSEEDEYPDGAGGYFRSLDIYVKHFDGSAWVAYGAGGPLDITATDTALSPSLALNSSNQPSVAWVEGNDGTRLYVKQWNGSTWTSSGPLDSDPVQIETFPALAIRQVAGVDTTILTWVETNKLQVKKFQGSWNPFVGLPANAPFSEDSLAITSGGQPVVATQNFVASDEYLLSIYGWRTAGWGPLGNELDTLAANNASLPSLALQSDNDPVVAWQENGDVFAKEWNNTSSSWSALGGAVEPTGTNTASDPSTALDSTNVPYVALVENDGASDNIYVRSWNGSTWVSLGSALDNNPAQAATQPSLTLRGSFAPHIAFTEGDGTSTNIYVKSWNGSAWQAVGGALDTALANNASHASLALDSSGNPVVAWQEVGAGSSNIYVKRWDGTTWKALGTQLDTVPGNEAITPSLALQTNNNPIVVWSEAGIIYTKRWSGRTWIAYTKSANVVTTHTALTPSLTLKNNIPVVAFVEDGNLFVRRWRSATVGWQTFGRSTSIVDRNPANQTANPAIAMQTGTEFRPVVAWDENDGTSTNVYVSRY
jgi:hypothetical protein